MNVWLLFAWKRLLGVSSLATIFFPLISSCFSLAQETSIPQIDISPRSLITQPIDEAQRTVLKGNTHPLARPQFDLGTAPATLPMQRMLLVLKRSPEQESALRKLLDDQQDKHSPNYHKWLTPEQYGKAFGPSDADMQVITSWLQSHGFQVGTSKGRTVLEFSGSASQVQETFHTTIHKYIVNEEQHWANASDPSIPTALTPAVAGVLTLHNFLKRPHLIMSKQMAEAKIRPGKSPTITFSDGTHGIAPLDFATIYNSPSSLNSGDGITIGVIGRSNLYSVDSPAEDITDFRSSQIFNLPGGSFNVILNGPDPGDLGGTEEAEATLDSTWSGAVAPGSNIAFVVSATTNTTDGVDLSEVYIIENNLADVMTESFGTCEGDSTSAEATGTSDLAEQGAAQGITYFVSTGDSGAEGCDNPDTETVAIHPISVSLTASTPFTIAVGGNVFNDTANPATYWSSTNTNQESALSYIPEDVWNDSCLASSCGANANIAAGGGGSSMFFTKPSWQAGVTGILSDNTRDIPDVSLSASPHDGYVLCLEGSCVPNSQGEFSLFLIGGTSASTPSFAGIMALVEFQQSQTNPSTSPRQGLANYVLYPLAASENATLSQCNGSSTTVLPASTCIFHDVTVGNNAVPGEVNYGTPSALYQAGVGYDEATGLGSVNITNLVNQWNSIVSKLTATTTTLDLNGATTPITISHGTSVSVVIAVTASSGTPAGDVSLLAATGPSVSTQTGVGFFTLRSGTVTSSTSLLPGGTSYSVTAQYAGNGTFAPSVSSPGIQVTVKPEASTTALSNFTQVVQNNQIVTVPISNGASLAFGNLVFVRADVTGSSGQGTPTGQVAFTDTFGALPGPIFNPVANPVALNSEGNTSIGAGVVNFDAGNHSISASYAGDNSFSTSSSTQPVTFTITPGFTGVSGLANVTVASPGASGTTTLGIIASTGFNTAVSVTCSGSLPAGVKCSTPSITANGPNKIVTGTITVTTTAATAATLQRKERPYYFAVVVLGGLPLAGIVLLGAPKRRVWGSVLGLVLLAFLIGLPACGGGGGSSTPAPPPPATVTPTPAGTYTINVTATAGSATQQEGSFTLVVQ